MLGFRENYWSDFLTDMLSKLSNYCCIFSCGYCTFDRNTALQGGILDLDIEFLPLQNKGIVAMCIYNVTSAAGALQIKLAFCAKRKICTEFEMSEKGPTDRNHFLTLRMPKIKIQDESQI